MAPRSELRDPPPRDSYGARGSDSYSRDYPRDPVGRGGDRLDRYKMKNQFVVCVAPYQPCWAIILILVHINSGLVVYQLRSN